MLTKGQVMTIKKLLNKNVSKRAIAKRLCISRDTVKRYADLNFKECLKFKTRNYPCERIAPYMNTIENMLKVSNEQNSAIPVSAIYDEIKNMGYKGTLRWLQKFIKTRKIKELGFNQAMIVRFETNPGVQMQIDWIEFKKDGLSAFVATLGYSRTSYVEYVDNESIQTLIRCHMNAFNYFGGICRECLYDNMKTIILKRHFYGYAKHKYNPLFEDFAKHCGFKISVCRPYRPETKGKVERFNRYLRYSFHNPMIVKFKIKNYHLTIDIANVEVLKWLDEKANKRIHSTTKKQPFELLEEERKFLLPIQKNYQGIHPDIVVKSYNENRTIPSNSLDFLNDIYKIPQRDMRCYDEFILQIHETTTKGN
ncbi:IS21 family transposase [Campylobacter sp. 7477a]|uniref:IS21 family transposase n=1 Tax=Campylobacter sp. 7477a TaxID=2735741 RepID=UPI0030152881|nr:IS21 family transposase [Campylobacter sp. 7477a]